MTSPGSMGLRPPKTSATIGEHGARRWVYADAVHGRFARARNLVYSVLIVFYVAAPWLSVGSQPFLRFDIPGRRYSVFGVTFVATDLYLLALFLLMATVGLFLFSALLGRLWCGWACPQTVYLEGVFRRIDRWLEGSPLKRRKLDSGLRDDVYWTKKIIKHALFLALSVVLALSFTAYFIGPRASFEMLVNLGAGHTAALITAVFITALTYWNFAWFREQFCTFLCPYARFQAVMLDDHSLIVGYDPARGEPRGPRRPDEPTTLGDCIDCRRCVQVCPTGIDIREGLQLECVSCTACIDACDTVMERLGKPRGLIRYDSQAGLAGQPRKVLRLRVALYSLILLVLLGVFTGRLMGREVVELTVARSPGIPYLVQENGRVRNLFRLHITNTGAAARTLTLELDGPADAELLVPGQPFTVAAGERLTAEAFVLLPRDEIHAARTPIRFRLMEHGAELSAGPSVFLGPVHHGETHADDD